MLIISSVISANVFSGHYNRIFTGPFLVFWTFPMKCFFSGSHQNEFGNWVWDPHCGWHQKRRPPPPVGTWQVLGLSGPSGREAHQTPHPAWSTGPPPNQNVRPIYQTNIRHWSSWHQTNIRQTSDTSPCLVNWASLWSTGPPPNQNVRRMRPARRISHWALMGPPRVKSKYFHSRIATEASWKKRVHSTPST